jgi:hypothetical protein
MSKKNVTKLTYEEKMAKIEEFALRSNEICANNNNRKLGKACISVPFPVTVCNPNAPCFQKCYAQHGCQGFANVQGAYYRNLRLYNNNADDFFEQLHYKIKWSGLPMVRFFDSGDYPDAEFLQRSVELAKQFPNVKFMAFTKKYHLVNEYLDNGGKLPDNYNIVFSAWDALWEVPNPYGLPVAYVKFKEERFTPVIPKNAFHCPGRESSCSMCGVCWNRKVKAVYFDEH